MVIELIDEYLERLVEARRLLAEFDLVANRRKAATTTRATKPRSIEKKKPEPEIQLIEKKTTPPALPISSPVKPQSRKRAAAVKPSVKTDTSALGGSIPAGPIVVSAQQIRIEKSLRQEVSAVERKIISSPASIPLTPELLAKRWLQSSASQPESKK